MQFTETQYDLERCDKYISPLYWKDINLQSIIYTKTSKDIKIYVYIIYKNNYIIEM